MNYTDTLNFLKKYNQEHLLEYYSELLPKQKVALLDEIDGIDFDVLSNLTAPKERTIGELSTPDALTAKEIDDNRAYYEKVGISALSKGKVAALLLAGGQGTRLGFDGPKGTYNMGESRVVSIFELQIEGIKRVAQRVGKPFTLFIMTSNINNDATISFFEENNYFGYPKERVHFFVQKMSPSCSFDGKIFLEEKGKIALSPNGNGGWYESLMSSDCAEVVYRERIEWFNVYAVDNVLQRICDPAFIGATIASGLGCGAKVVSKVSAEERVGLLCKEDGIPTIIEYYELSEETASLRDESGNLVYRYGVILNYLFRRELLDEAMEGNMPWHLATKKIAHMENGVKVFPTEPNGYKFETLATDMVRLMGSCLAVEVVREREFAPVKNKEGNDSVESARELLKANGIKL